MGRIANDGRGRFGGRQAGVKNRPKSYKAMAAKIIDEDRRAGQALGIHVTLVAALVVAESLAELVAAITGRRQHPVEANEQAGEGSVCI